MTMKTEMNSTSGDGELPPPGKDLDSVALATIRDLIASEEDEIAVRAKSAPSDAPVQTGSPAMDEEAASPLPADTSDPVTAVVREAVAKQPEPTEQKSAPKQPGTGFVGRIKQRVTGYRPTRKHIAYAALALLVLLRPWLVVGIVFLTLFFFIGLFLILGYDGFWKRAMGLAHWYARRRPSRAAELHAKLDAFALKWDTILDRFPEGTVDALYLPDFGDLATADARHDEALERRLATLREGEA